MVWDAAETQVRLYSKWRHSWCKRLLVLMMANGSPQVGLRSSQGVQGAAGLVLWHSCAPASEASRAYSSMTTGLGGNSCFKTRTRASTGKSKIFIFEEAVAVIEF